MMHLGDRKRCVKSGAGDMRTAYSAFSGIILIHTCNPGIINKSTNTWSRISRFGHYILWL